MPGLPQEKLRPPLVACCLGRLYNKEKVLCAMLEKTLPPHMKHVRSLKDMRECEVEVGYTISTEFKHTMLFVILQLLFLPQDGHTDLLMRASHSGVFLQINASTGFPVCAITKADLSSGVRACIIWPCGFIVSNKALEALTKNVLFDWSCRNKNCTG